MLKECDARVKTRPPVTKRDLHRLREFAGGDLPSGLEMFLLKSNGLLFDCDTVVFSAEQIIEQSKSISRLDICMPTEHLLFIGGLGDGDMFAFGRARNGDWLHDVYWWEHETDSRYACGLGIWGYVAAHVSWRHFHMA
jgi:hypothetical protein